jgi:hypothetical protein
LKLQNEKYEMLKARVQVSLRTDRADLVEVTARSERGGRDSRVS